MLTQVLQDENFIGSKDMVLKCKESSTMETKKHLSSKDENYHSVNDEPFEGRERIYFISERLTLADVNSILSYCSSMDIPRMETRNNTNPGLELMNYLRRRQLITLTDISYLERVSTELHLSTVSEAIQESSNLSEQAVTSVKVRSSTSSSLDNISSFRRLRPFSRLFEQRYQAKYVGARKGCLELFVTGLSAENLKKFEEDIASGELANMLTKILLEENLMDSKNIVLTCSEGSIMQTDKQLSLKGLSRMAEDASYTVGDAVHKFELIIRRLKNCPFRGVDGALIFDEKLITELRKVANKIERERRKKNFGVIGGSAAGIVGGVMAIAGVALVPFTFGTSIGLIATGTAIGVTGAGVSLGFSLDKKFKDKRKIPIIQDALEKFIRFQHDLAVAMTLISVCDRHIAEIKTTSLVGLQLTQRNETHLAIMHLEKKVNTLFNGEEDHRSIHGKLQGIMQCAEIMAAELKNILEPIKPLFVAKQSLFEEQLKEATQNPFNMLASCVPRNEENDIDPHTNPTFQSFVRRFVWNDNMTKTKESVLDPLACIRVNATGRVVAQGGIAGGRIALGFVNTADNVAQVGGSILRIARAVSVAGIVLGAIGIVVDIGFLGHAIHDLKKKDAEDLSQSFIDLAKAMEKINVLSTEY